MSFNSRLGSSRVHRGRPSNKFHREPQAPSRSHEDAQPNELLGKRVTSGPPAVRSSAPQSHRSWRGHHPSRGRGSASSPRRWSVHGTQFKPQITSRGVTSTHGQSGNTTRSQSWNSSGGLRDPVAIDPPNPSPVNRAANAPPRDPTLLLPPAVPDQNSGFGTKRQGQSPANSGNATHIHPSTPCMASSGISGSSSSSWPPPKRRKVVRSDQRSDNHRLRKSPPPAMVQKPFGAVPIPVNENNIATRGQMSVVTTSASIPSSSRSFAFASDILLTDSSLLSGENTAAPLIPIPKRLKVIPPGAAAPVRPSPSSTSDNAVPSPTVPDVHTASAATSNSSPLSISSSMQVKRERSPSPSLAPRLVTEGCVRVAPLPPECRNKRPNFQAARQQLAAVEMKKLRVLGLQIVRVFTREDGMVIDWKSAVPVLSDTLRPPPRSPPPTVDPRALNIAGSTVKPPAPTLVRPTITRPDPPHITQCEQPVNRPKKRRKPSSENHDNIVFNLSPAGLMSDPARIASSSQGAASFAVPLPTHSLPTDKPRDPAPPQHAPPAAKKPKPAARSSAPRPASHVIDLTEDRPPSIPTPPSYVAGSIARPTTPHTHMPALDPLSPLSGSRATRQPPPTAGLSSSSTSTHAHPAVLKAAPAAHPPVHAHVSPPIGTGAPASHVPAPPIVSLPRAATLSPVHAPAPPTQIAQEEVANAALNFLRRYLNTFTSSRASLAPAYAPRALFSFHTHTPSGVSRHPLQQGRAAIAAALRALPADISLCSWPPAPHAHELQWDVGCVPGSASGDVLLACYAVQEYASAAGAAACGRENGDANGSGKGKRKEKGKEKGTGKGKGKERAGVPGARERWSCEQRFVLRRRDLDVVDGDGHEEDRNAAELWPLVVVSHQMRVRLLP